MLYFDNNATTPPAPEVIRAMLPYFETHWGNASSLHAKGREAAAALERAREQVAALLGAKRPSEISFTSGGTEGDCAAIRGICEAQADKRHVLTTAVEHNAVRQPCKWLETQGYRVTTLGVDRHGLLDMAAFAAHLTPDTALVSVMWANNETGVMFPIAQIASLCAERNIPLHVDAVQAAGKIPIDVQAVPVSALSISAHKFHGPKGVGALYVRRGTPFRALIIGGSQEYGRRAGTEAVPLAVGCGEAAALAVECLQTHCATMAAKRDRLESGICRGIEGVTVNGAVESRVPNTSNISIEQTEGESLIFALSQADLCASTGSACSQGSTEPSHVLVAMHLSQQRVRGTLRLSISRYTSDDDITRAIAVITQVVQERRRTLPR